MKAFEKLGLTEMETKAIMFICEDALSDIGEYEPRDLLDQNASWFNHRLIADAEGFTIAQVRGIVTSLKKKGFVEEYDPTHKFGWCLTDEGIELCQKLYDAAK